MNTRYPYCAIQKCQQERYADNGILRLLCEEHYKEDEPRRQAENRRRVKKWNDNNPDKLKRRAKASRQNRKSLGQCVFCDNPVKHKGGSECAYHLKKAGERQQRYISKDRTALKRAQKKYASKNREGINAYRRERYHNTKKWRSKTRVQ